MAGLFMIWSMIPSALLGLFYRGVDHVAIGAHPVCRVDEFAALNLEDLDPAATLVIGRGDFERWHEAAQAETADRFQPLLDVVAGRLLAAIRLQRVADRLDMDGGLQQTAVVVDRVFVHALEGLLALLLVHLLDLLPDRILVTGAGELHGV